MYRTNLPDGVVIPDSLIVHVELGVLSDQAKADVRAWVNEHKISSQFFKDFWREHLLGNVALCKKYGIPECVRLFSFVCTEIEAIW